MIFLTFAALCALVLGVRIARWIHNYIQALRYGLPIILLPVSSNEPLWMVFRPLFSWVEHLPLGLGRWYLYTTMGWPTEDGIATTLRLGENFVLCSPLDNIIVLAEPAAIERIWTDKRDMWRMPESQSQLFAFFGQNVSSTHGEVWKRHRSITMKAFNERTAARVWQEARLQASEMAAGLHAEQEKDLGKLRSTFDVLAMRVLMTVAFGQEFQLTSVQPGHRQSMMESLGFILQHILLTVVFNSLKAPDFLLPAVLRKLKVSVKEFRLYMEELILAHMRLASSASQPTAGRPSTSLLQAMIQANEMEKQEGLEGKNRNYLTNAELYGNIFVFNLGGFETTAASLCLALPFLASHPEFQPWVAEELSKHSPASDEDGSQVEYATTFPHLVRTLAVLYETLRLASHAPLFIKTPLQPVELEISTPSGLKSITVKPGTIVGMNQYGAHLSPRWGPDALTFNPKRFIATEDGEEKIKVPEGPLYAPWMIGPRVCPAKKFSQVEFVGIMSRLLAAWRVEVVQMVGESREDARARVHSVLMKEKYFNVSAHLKNPQAAALRFVPQEP